MGGYAKIYEKDQKIFLTFRTTDLFDEILKICRNNRCRWHPDKKVWEIPHLSLQNVSSELQKYDLKFENNVNLTERKPNDIVTFDPPIFNEQYLFFPPIKGLPPHENYQLEDIKKALSTNRYALYLEMGLGKSYIIANILTQLYLAGKVKKILVLAPYSGYLTLAHDIRRFSNETFNPDNTLIGNSSLKEPFLPEKDLIVMPYGTFRVLSDHYHQRLSGKEGKNYRKPTLPLKEWIGDDKACLVCDESHYLGNVQSRISKVLNLHKHFFYFRYLSTGTPATKFEKYYNQINLLSEKIIDMTYYNWLKTVANTGNRFSEVAINYFYPEKMESFVQTISPYVSRRLQKEHLQLPEHYVKKIYLPLPKEQRSIYYTIFQRTIDTIVKTEGGLQVKSVVTKFPYLTLALDNPNILKRRVPKGEIRTLDSWDFSKHGKLPALRELVEDLCGEQGEQIVIWTSHPDTATELATEFEKYKPIVVNGETQIPTGKTRDEVKFDLVKQFKENPEHKILIAGIQVLNTSVTITNASHQIYFDRTYSAEDYYQSQKRLHRISQTRPVTTYLLIFDETLDVSLDQNLEKKISLDQMLFKKNELTEEEWMKLLTGKLL